MGEMSHDRLDALLDRSNGQIRASSPDDAEVYAEYLASGRVIAAVAARYGWSKDRARRRVIRAVQANEGDPSLSRRDEEQKNRLSEHVRRANFDPNVSGRIVGRKMREWGVAAKNAEGKLETTTLFATEFSLADVAPQWPVIQPAASAPVLYAPRPQELITSDLERVFLWPDTQIGYYRDLRTDKLEPFHDLAAIDVALQILYTYQPHRVVILGDFLDCASLSRYLQVAEFQLTLQPSIDFGFNALAQIRSIVGPDCRIDYLAGNHERRVSEYIATNAKAAYGLRRACDTSGWPALSIPSLLNLEELGISYSDEYPGGQVWLADDLVATHAPGSVRDLRASEIHGHHPAAKVSSHTVHYRDGAKTYYQYCIPGLMRIDDVAEPTRLQRSSVPSTRARGSWNQGIGVVSIAKNGKHLVEIVPIKDGHSIYGGREYHAAV